jgi:hypothetical protein
MRNPNDNYSWARQFTILMRLDVLRRAHDDLTVKKRLDARFMEPILSIGCR